VVELGTNGSRAVCIAKQLACVTFRVAYLALLLLVLDVVQQVHETGVSNTVGKLGCVKVTYWQRRESQHHCFHC
jgi:hypothetical protein